MYDGPCTGLSIDPETFTHAGIEQAAAELAARDLTPEEVVYVYTLLWFHAELLTACARALEARVGEAAAAGITEGAHGLHVHFHQPRPRYDFGRSKAWQSAAQRYEVALKGLKRVEERLRNQGQGAPVPAQRPMIRVGIP